MEEAGAAFEAAPELPVVDAPTIALSLESAEQRLGAEILDTLRQRFNGKLTGVRLVDARDKIL